jgi:cell wall-associated NlpC family hydrolase
MASGHEGRDAGGQAAARATLGGRARRFGAAFVAFLSLGLFLSGLAPAEPAAITDAREEAQALWERIDQLNEELSVAVEEYNYALAMLGETQAAAHDTKLRLTQADADLAVANSQLATRLVEIYKEGETGLLDALMSAASFSELLNRIDWIERMSSRDAELVAEVEEYQAAQTAISVELAQQMEEERALVAQAEAAKAEVEEKVAANEAALAEKQEELAQLIKEEEERQARLREAARRAAEAAQRAAEEAARLPNRIVASAMDCLGAPYVWGANGPNSFDCSGLVQYVFGKHGISLPHSSALQARLGTPVTRTGLRPGDLIFFYNPIHHVAIYIGEGKMIHAAGVGRGVRIDYVSNHSSYNCARRVIP